MTDVAAVGQLLEAAAHDGLAVVVHARRALAEALESVTLDEPRERRGPGAHADDVALMSPATIFGTRELAIAMR